ncbi:unnamed protein product [Rangifer tarandus platyrhynchus]|uniref:Uncharacterized protein n=1 Tax=Rangifer tarandus platyrhynchus TaxID=3082113 RepID=A0ABN8Y5U6_RANTA|nr:unnamed protein product [Rangifer tarandus platyrhynchus]
MPQKASRACQTAVPFQYKSTSDIKINTHPDTPANPLSLPFVTPAKAGGMLPARTPGPVVKHLPANAGDMGSIPDLGRSRMLWGNQACVPQLLKPAPRVHALQRESSQ